MFVGDLKYVSWGKKIHKLACDRSRTRCGLTIPTNSADSKRIVLLDWWKEIPNERFVCKKCCPMKNGHALMRMSKATFEDAVLGIDQVNDFGTAFDDYHKEIAINNGKCRMGYLARVSSDFKAGCVAHLPTAVVEWEYTIMGFRRETARHDCHPMVLLQAIMDVLRPSGKCHVTAIDNVLIAPGTEIYLKLVFKADGNGNFWQLEPRGDDAKTT